MKTKNIGEKMTLNKKTVANLSGTKMSEVKGGIFIISITRTSGHIACYCDSVRWCTCPDYCPF
jgi:hypothetical protein